MIDILRQRDCEEGSVWKEKKYKKKISEGEGKTRQKGRRGDCINENDLKLWSNHRGKKSWRNKQRIIKAKMY